MLNATYASAADAVLHFGFTPQTFAEEKAPDTEADPPIYGPNAPDEFEAFDKSLDGEHATTQFLRGVDVLVAFVRSREPGPEGETIASHLLWLKSILQERRSSGYQLPYLSQFYSRGKRDLDGIVAKLAESRSQGNAPDPLDLERLQILRRLSSCHSYCGRRVLEELQDANLHLGHLGSGLKQSVLRVCQNTAEVIITQTLGAVDSEDAIFWRANVHQRPEFEHRLGLPWRREKTQDPNAVRGRSAADMSIDACRRALIREVTPSSVAQVLARECLDEVRTTLKAAGISPEHAGDTGWTTLSQLTLGIGSRFGPLTPEMFFRKDAGEAATSLVDDPQDLLPMIHSNLQTLQLTPSHDGLRLWEDETRGVRRTLQIKNHDWLFLVEHRGDDTPIERAATPQDLRATLMAAANPRPDQREYARRLATPAIGALLCEPVMPTLPDDPAQWEVDLLRAPGLLTAWCGRLPAEQTEQLLIRVIDRRDPSDSGVAGVALSVALARRIQPAVHAALSVLDPSALRAAWPSVLAALSGADESLTDMILDQLDRLSPTDEALCWRACRRELHRFAEQLRESWGRPEPLPPLPGDVLQRLGSLRGEGLLPSALAVLLLRIDAQLGFALAWTSTQKDASHLRYLLDVLAQAGRTLALPPADMLALLRPAAQLIRETRLLSSPLTQAVLGGRTRQVSAFIDWVETQVKQGGMPPVIDLVLPTHATTLLRVAPHIQAPAFDTYLNGLVALRRKELLSEQDLAPLRDFLAHRTVAVPEAPRFALVRAAMNQPEPKAADPVDAEASLQMPDPFSEALNQAPWTWSSLNGNELERQLLHHGRRGYLTPDGLIFRLDSLWSTRFADHMNLGLKGKMRVLTGLAGHVITAQACVDLLQEGQASTDWRSTMLGRANPSEFDSFFALLRRLAELGATEPVAAFLRSDDRPPSSITLTAECLRGAGAQEAILLLLDGAIALRRDGHLSATELREHFAARPSSGGAWALSTLLDPRLWADAPPIDHLRERLEQEGLARLRGWLERLHTAASESLQTGTGERLLSPMDAFSLLTAPDGDGNSPLHATLAHGQAGRLPLLFDWLGREAVDRSTVLGRKLASLLQAINVRTARGAAFEAIAGGKVAALAAWLEGIRRLRELSRLSDGEYLTLLVPATDGDRAVLAAGRRGDVDVSSCLMLMRQAVDQGIERGWLDDSDEDLRDLRASLPKAPVPVDGVG